MRFPQLARLVVLLLLLVPSIRAQTARPGYLTGRAATAAGAPLAGVRLRVVGTTDVGIRSALDVRTKPDGSYALRLPAGHFSLRSANWDVTRDNRRYALPLYLEGENNDDFDSTDGSLANLTLRMSDKTSARKAADDEQAWFGGTLELEYVTSDGGTVISYPDNVQVRVELVPDGPQFDGAPAQAQTYSRPVAGTHRERFLLDVPLATYVARVSFLTPAGTTPALVGGPASATRAGEPPFAPTTRVSFPPRSGDAPLLAYGGVDKAVLRVVLPAGGFTAAAAGPDSVRAGDSAANPPAAVPPAPAAAGPAGWTVGDHANVLRSPALGQWHPGTIVRVKHGQFLIKFDEFGAEHNEWVDASRLKPFDADDAAIDTSIAAAQTRPPAAPATGVAWKIGDAVNVLRSPSLGLWHTGRIIREKRGQYLIQYDEFGPEQNEWVEASRLKPREE